MNKEHTDLVSVVIPTYNRAAFILETLDSIHRQSYPVLELIVSDDGSSDNTVALCRQWMTAHRARFVRTLLLTVPHNTGIAANRNRGERQAQGRWVKAMDSDDILLPDAITQYVEHLLRHPEITYCFARVNIFSDRHEEIPAVLHSLFRYELFALSAGEQYNSLVKGNSIPANTLFYDRAKNDTLGIRCDESIPLLDDWPRWINITARGEKLYLLDIATVDYRIHSDNITYSTKKAGYHRSSFTLWLKYQFPYYFRQNPRNALIKYIIIQQHLTRSRLWHRAEKIGRAVDPLYRKLRHSSANDWENISQLIAHQLAPRHEATAGTVAATPTKKL